MEVVVGKSQATQVLSAYDDEVSVNTRDTKEPLECGPLVYKLVDENNESPSFIKSSEANSTLKLSAKATAPEDIGAH